LTPSKLQVDWREPYYNSSSTKDRLLKKQDNYLCAAKGANTGCILKTKLQNHHKMD